MSVKYLQAVCYYSFSISRQDDCIDLQSGVLLDA